MRNDCRSNLVLLEVLADALSELEPLPTLSRMFALLQQPAAQAALGAPVARDGAAAANAPVVRLTDSGRDNEALPAAVAVAPAPAPVPPAASGAQCGSHQSESGAEEVDDSGTGASEGGGEGERAAEEANGGGGDGDGDGDGEGGSGADADSGGEGGSGDGGDGAAASDGVRGADGGAVVGDREAAASPAMGGGGATAAASLAAAAQQADADRQEAAAATAAAVAAADAEADPYTRSCATRRVVSVVFRPAAEALPAEADARCQRRQRPFVSAPTRAALDRSWRDRRRRHLLAAMTAYLHSQVAAGASADPVPRRSPALPARRRCLAPRLSIPAPRGGRCWARCSCGCSRRKGRMPSFSCC